MAACLTPVASQIRELCPLLSRTTHVLGGGNVGCLDCPFQSCFLSVPFLLFSAPPPQEHRLGAISHPLSLENTARICFLRQSPQPINFSWFLVPLSLLNLISQSGVILPPRGQ